MPPWGQGPWLTTSCSLTGLSQQTGGAWMTASWSLALRSVPAVPRSASWSIAFGRAMGHPDPQLSVGSNQAGRSAEDLWKPLPLVPSGTGEACSTSPGNSVRDQTALISDEKLSSSLHFYYDKIVLHPSVSFHLPWHLFVQTWIDTHLLTTSCFHPQSSQISTWQPEWFLRV